MSPLLPDECTLVYAFEGLPERLRDGRRGLIRHGLPDGA